MHAMCDYDVLYVVTLRYVVPATGIPSGPRVLEYSIVRKPAICETSSVVHVIMLRACDKMIVVSTKRCATGRVAAQEGIV